MIDIRVKTERHSKLLMSLVSSGVDGHDFSSLHNEVYMSNSLILSDEIQYDVSFTHRVCTMLF